MPALPDHCAIERVAPEQLLPVGSEQEGQRLLRRPWNRRTGKCASKFYGPNLGPCVRKGKIERRTERKEGTEEIKGTGQGRMKRKISQTEENKRRQKNAKNGKEWKK